MFDFDQSLSQYLLFVSIGGGFVGAIVFGMAIEKMTAVKKPFKKLIVFGNGITCVVYLNWILSLVVGNVWILTVTGFMLIFF